MEVRRRVGSIPNGTVASGNGPADGQACAKQCRIGKVLGNIVGFANILAGGVLAVIVALLMWSIPISMIFAGGYTLGKCPADPDLPSVVIALGSVTLIRVFFGVLQRFIPFKAAHPFVKIANKLAFLALYITACVMVADNPTVRTFGAVNPTLCEPYFTIFVFWILCILTVYVTLYVIVFFIVLGITLASRCSLTALKEELAPLMY